MLHLFLGVGLVFRMALRRVHYLSCHFARTLIAVSAISRPLADTARPGGSSLTAEGADGQYNRHITMLHRYRTRHVYRIPKSIERTT